MHLIKEVLRLTAAGLSQRQIGRSLHLSHGVVGKYQAAAQRTALSWPLSEELDDAALADRLGTRTDESSVTRANARRTPPDFVSIHEQLKQKGVTRLLLWEEYRAAHPGDGYGYTQFCFHYQEWQSHLKLVMRQTHRAGEKLFIDYAGPTVSFVNAATGEVREAQIFVAVLGASNYTYAEATWTQGLPDWIGSHTRAFTFFGGVTELVVPDNLLSAVSKACRYGPLVNTSYYQMLAHYGTAGAACPSLQTQRQSQSGSRGAGRGALDPGALAATNLLLALCLESGDSRTTHRPQPASVQETARLPALPVRGAGPTGIYAPYLTKLTNMPNGARPE